MALAKTRLEDLRAPSLVGLSPYREKLVMTSFYVEVTFKQEGLEI